MSLYRLVYKVLNICFRLLCPVVGDCIIKMKTTFEFNFNSYQAFKLAWIHIFIQLFIKSAPKLIINNSWYLLLVCVFRYSLLSFFQDVHVRVSIYLAEGLQHKSGRYTNTVLTHNFLDIKRINKIFLTYW